MATFLNSFPMPPAPLSELSSLPLPEVESWFDPSEYSQASSSNNQCASTNCSSAVFPVSASVSATPSNCQLCPNHVHRQSSIFPNLNVLPSVSVYVEKSRIDTAPTQLSALPVENANKSTMLALDEDCSGTVLDQLQLHETSALNVQRAANLSPLSDVSSPSDFEAHSHSPFPPQHFPTNDSESCCTALPGVYSSILGATEESDSRSTSPSLASDDELSQINQSVCEEKLDTPLPAAIAPQASLFPLLNLNANTETHSEANAAAVNARGECPKVESTKNSKSKRSRRRNLIRALKEQTADGNYSGSEGEVMNSQPCAPARSKRSYIALLGEEGKALDGEDDECKASNGSKRDRNKASASAYRKRRKIYLDTLEARVASLNECVKAKDEELTKLHSENRVLKEQVSFLKRLINFKATDEELKETSTDNAFAQSSTSSSVAVSTSSSSAFGISNSRLSFGPQFSSNGSSRHATLFLFVLFCCFLLFNPLWTGMDLSAGVSDSSSLSMPVGRLGRSLLAFDNAAISSTQMASSSAAAAPHPYFLSSAVVKEVNEAAQLRFFEEEAAKDVKQIIPSNKQENSSIPSDATSVSSTSDQSATNSNNLRAFSELAASFDMAPNSQQFAELVASAYLPLVSILGEAATQAALRELATGVFFIQQHALLQAITHAVNTNLTTLSK